MKESIGEGYKVGISEVAAAGEIGVDVKVVEVGANGRAAVREEEYIFEEGVRWCLS